MLIFAFLLFVFAVLVLRVFHSNSSGKNRVPGPFKFPLIGSLHAFLLSSEEGKCGCEIWTQWARKYGKIFHVQLGVFNVFVVTDLQLAKRVLASDDWINRPQHPYVAEASGGTIKGIIWNNGSDWKETRRYTLATLKKFGFGKTADMDHVITKEALDIKRHFQSQLLSGLPSSTEVCFRDFFTISSLNVIWSSVAGQRFDRNDAKAHRMLRSVRELSARVPIGSDPTLAFPALRHVLPSMADYFVQEYTKVIDFISNTIEEKKYGESLGVEETFFDAFFTDIEAKIHPSITREQLLLTVADLIFGGAETSSLSMEFAVLAMALYPQVQEQIHNEVKTVVGSERLPTFSDLLNMPYSHAAVLEVLRLANTLPMVLRSNVHEIVKIGDIEIPQGSILYFNSFGCHVDPDVWQTPMEFEPGRFLSPNGSIVNTDKIMPFGYGKRMCPGNIVGKATIFSFLTTLVQSFRVEPCPGDDLRRKWMKFDDGFTLSPKTYSVRISARSNDPLGK